MLPHTSVLAFPSLKNSRRYGAKVRTGCKTCKNRRVKCDESRPYCSRCISTGRKCDGYTQDFIIEFQAKTQASAHVSRNIVPKLSGSSDGLQYLEFYHYCAGHLLSSNFDNGFWSRTALQMAQTESAVRHALVTLGYLHLTEPGDLKHARSVFTSSHQNRTFLFHYNTAVRGLIDRMNDSSYAPEVGLVTSLLFVCVEFIRGNYHAAFAHLNGGLKIVSEWQKERLRNLIGNSSCPQTLLEVRNGFLGPTTEIEDNLLPMFNRTITSALLYGVDVQQIFEFPQPMPRRFHEHPFSSISEAQTSNLNLRNPTILFLRTMAKKLILREPITNEDIQKQMHLLECHHAWLQALQMLEKELPNEDRIKASSLKVAYYATYIALTCGLEVAQTPYDAHISSFKALINHAKIVLEFSRGVRLPPSPSPVECNSSPSISSDTELVNTSKSNEVPHRSANFTFEISLIPCLYLTATRCRCPVTRREAVSLLALNPPREGLWDAEQHLAVANRVIEIEENEVDPDTGWPLEAARLWCAVIDGNMDQNGGFWVIFALANWVQAGSQFLRGNDERRRLDAQWEEWFVL